MILLCYLADCDKATIGAVSLEGGEGITEQREALKGGIVPQVGKGAGHPRHRSCRSLAWTPVVGRPGGQGRLWGHQLRKSRADLGTLFPLFCR